MNIFGMTRKMRAQMSFFEISSSARPWSKRGTPIWKVNKSCRDSSWLMTWRATLQWSINCTVLVSPEKFSITAYLWYLSKISLRFAKHSHPNTIVRLLSTSLVRTVAVCGRNSFSISRLEGRVSLHSFSFGRFPLKISSRNNAHSLIYRSYWADVISEGRKIGRWRHFSLVQKCSA